MPKTLRDILTGVPGSPSRELDLFLAQLDDQTRRLTEDTRGLTRAALEWQPAPGMNTIGMLLAHLAIVEVFWMQVGPLGRTSYSSTETLGITMDDDGMPLAPRGRPPKVLAGRTLKFYDDLLARARRYAREVAATLADADLDREVRRKRRDGQVQVLNLRWVFYHVLEHFAGHYGQILLLRHHFRAARRKRSR